MNKQQFDLGKLIEEESINVNKEVSKDDKARLIISIPSTVELKEQK